MSNDINFKNIVPRGGSQTKAFEELCTQLAPKTLQNTETFERYHGDGGDGGVECLATSSDGSCVGWQSKFVNNIDDLIKQASLSLATAVKVHSTLRKYILCFPFDITGQTGRTTKSGRPAQSGSLKLTNWIKDSLANYKIEGAVLQEIELWPANRLTELLLQHDASAGIRTYFFSDTAIPQNWFEKNVLTGIKKAGPRYNPQLSVETDVWKSFAAFGQTDSWNAVIVEELDNVRKRLKEFGSNIDKPSTDPVFPGLPKKYSAQANSICDGTEVVLQSLAGTLTDSVLANTEKQLVKVIELVVQLEQALVADLNKEYKEEQWDNKRWRSFMAEYMISFPAACLDRTREVLVSLRACRDFVQSPAVQLSSERVFVLSGIGGSGKTHCICDVSAQRLNENMLSCIVFGDQFAGSPDEWTRFSEALGLKNISSDQLLDALNAAAEQSRKPLIVFLDAINETMPRNYWPNRITAFADEVTRRPFLKLCICCRSSFLQICLPFPNPFFTVEHTGFKGLERKACNAFFTFHRLNPPLIPILQPELSNPLYLKLVCEMLLAKNLKDLPPGWTGLLPVIKAFLFEKEKQLGQQYDVSPNGASVVKALTAIIEEITRRTESALSWTDATAAILKSNPPIGVHNLLDWLIKADLLIEDGPIENCELTSQTYVRPAFERLGDFLLATEIAKQATADGVKSFPTHRKVQEIFKDETLIGLNASLVAALSVILPENHGIELPSLFSGSLYKTIALIATKALVWRTPDSFTDTTRMFVQEACAEDGYSGMDALFAICTHESSIDASWISKLFESTNLAARDAFFASYLYTRYNENGIIKNLIEAYHDIDLSAVNEMMAYRWLIALLWFTAAPDRRIKDTATRAAVEILKHHNQLVTNLLDRLLLVNDEEVVERLLVIVYGALIINPDKKVLTQVSNCVIKSYENAPEMFENALIRDHIRCIVELAQRLNCLPKFIEPLISNRTRMQEDWTLAIPDETIVKTWKKEKGARGLAVDSALNDDFNHYSINCLNQWRRKNISKDVVGKWIINDVVERKGLTNELHNAYDITIVRETGGGRGKPAYAERIGKKYQWNSLYRLASILHDKVEPKRRSDPDPIRPPLILQDERKIDPTLSQPYFIDNGDSSNWWMAEKPDLGTTESLKPVAWLDFEKDIPAMQSVITVTRLNEQNWIPISGYVRYDTSKSGEYGIPYRSLTISINAYLISNADFEGMIKKLEGKNLYNIGLPSGSDFMHCYMGEYPWATACNTEPDRYLGVGDTLGDTDIVMHNATNQMVAEWEYDATLNGSMYVQVPSKKFFETGDLWWNDKDGYKREDQKTVFKDPRLETGGNLGMVADFDDLVARLKKLNFKLIWALKGHKILGNQQEANDRKYFSQICWMDASGQLLFGKRMFFNSYDAKTGIQVQIDKLSTRLKNAKGMMLDGEMERAEYKQILSELEPEIERLHRAKMYSDTIEDDYRLYLKQGLCLLKGIGARYTEADLERRQQITGVIFPEKLVYDNGTYRTTTPHPLFEVITATEAAFKGKGNRKGQPPADLSCQVAPTGIELYC